MRLFIAICFDENMMDSLNEIPFDRKKFMPHVTLIRKADCTKDKAFLPRFQESDPMRVNGISLMKSERGKHGMIYTEIGYVRAF